MQFSILLIIATFILLCTPPMAAGRELPKVAVWDLVPRNTPATHAQELTSILVSEITKLKKYEVYSQENVRALAGWSAERMKLGCTDSKCLVALGQMDIGRLLSGSVGKIGNRYTVSLNLFDTQNATAENAISEFCQTEDELIELVQMAVRKLLGEPLVAPPSRPALRARAEEEREVIVVRATDFLRGLDVAVGGPPNTDWGSDVLLNAPDYRYRPNAAEFDFNARKGRTDRLKAEYAAAQARPVRILVNGSLALSNALGSPTGCWEQGCQKLLYQGQVVLKPGRNVMRVERDNVFPHIRRFVFESLN
jgi:hypothetical protein